MRQNRHFKVIVAGENPEEIMRKYDEAAKTEPYVVFEFAKAKEYRENYLKSLEAILAHAEKEFPRDEQIQYLKEEIEEIKNESDSDFYIGLTAGLEIDKETMNAMSRENPDGKFTSYRVGGNFSLPFILKDGDMETYSARKGEIAWDKIHLANTRGYEVAWDTTHGLAEPQDEEEEKIYQNMKNMHAYFQNFENREHYIASMTAFWGLAFVDEKEWHELDGTTKQFDWVIGFYDKFIKPLSDDTLLTIYECVRPQSD